MPGGQPERASGGRPGIGTEDATGAGGRQAARKPRVGLLT
jgi:hypothetical protein